MTIPDHSTLRIGTLASILTEVAAHFGTERIAVAEHLFGE